MNNKRSITEKLSKSKTVFGLWNTYPAPGIIEGMCPGWDFVLIDGQHGEHTYDSILSACRTAENMGVQVIIRVPINTSDQIGRYADIAPSALMIPMVNTGDDAKNAADAGCFPPVGNRSFGGRRVIDITGRNYYTEKSPFIIAQIETMEGAENCEAIIGTAGIDCLMFGPDDMKVQLGIPVGEDPLENSRIRKLMEKTALAAERAGKYAACIAGNPDTVRTVTEMGYRIFISGSDSAFLRSASEDKLKILRSTAD
ncbi:MAG: HpcH/HpaI aldolase family protein [Spirochaetia bacterium]